MLHCGQLYFSRNSENEVLTGRGRSFLSSFFSDILLHLFFMFRLLCISIYYVCLYVYILYIIYCIYYILYYRGADKSLARQGRKQATETEDFDCHISHL
jgi:Ca2+/Na+ antiporter